ncbi:hypothetical protein D018_0993B, partial [Vibrio parahaemolyticus VP2007-007]
IISTSNLPTGFTLTCACNSELLDKQ